MFTPDHTVRTIERHEFFIPDGSTAKDLSDAFRVAQSSLPDRKKEYDDAFLVRAGDEGIILYYETEK